MTKASETYQLIEPFLKNDFASLFQKTGSGKGQDTEGIVIQLFDVSKEEIFDYSFSSAGFVAANAASAAGDLIFIPAGSLGLTAAFTLKAEVTLKGAGVYATFIVANGNYGALITLGADTCIEDFGVNYTSATSPYCIATATNSSDNIVRRVYAYFYPSVATDAWCFKTGTNSSFDCIEDSIFVCDGNGGQRTGLSAATIGHNAYIRNTYGYAHCNTASVNAYGIYASVAGGGPIFMYNCYGYGYAQGGNIGYGIFTTMNVESYSCHGKGQAGTSTAIGFEVNTGAQAFACDGEANCDGGGTRYGLVNNAGYMMGCKNVAAGSTYGIAVWGTAYAVGCKFEGTTADVLLNVGCNFHVYACQYDSTTGAGTLTKDPGDLSLGTGTDNRITQWNGTGGLLEDSNLVGPAANLLNLTNSAANTTLAMQFAAGKTLTLIGSDNRSLTFPSSGSVPICAGTEVANTLAIFTAAATLDDLANGTGYLYNDGAGSYSYVPLAEAPAWAINIDGALATGTNVGAFVSPGDGTILAVYIYCKTLGTANSTIVDCHITRTGVYADVTIFTDQGNRPTLAWNDADSYDKSGAPDIAAIQEGDILTFDIDAIATGAADISIILAVKWASISVAPIDAKYVVGAANAQLTGEIVKDYLEDNEDPDAYPSSPTAWDDEFEGGGVIDVKWTKVNDPLTDALNQTVHPGFLHVGLAEQSGTEVFDNQIRMYQAPPVWNDGDGTWEFVAKVNIGMTGLAAEGGEYCGVFLYLANSANDEFVGADLAFNDSASASFVWQRAGSAADNGSAGFTGMTTNRETVIQPGQEVYIKLQKYTGSGSGDYDQPHTYNAYASGDGIIWTQVGTISKDFTAVCDEIGLLFRRPKAQVGDPYGMAVVDFFRRVS